MASDTLYIADTMYFIFRSYFALGRNSSLHSYSGIPTGALYGLASSLKSMRVHFPMRNCICAFESETKNFRTEISPIYKANRPPVDPDLKIQIPLAVEMCRNLGYTAVNSDGFEADDVIASIACRALKCGWKVRILSKDKDLAQLLALEGDCAVVCPSKDYKKADSFIDRASCEAHYGVPAELIGDWLALQGDSADNIIGIKGVGPKTAAKILKEAGSLDNLIANPALAGKRFAALVESEKEQLLLNKRLTALRFDAPLPFEVNRISDFEIQGIGQEGIEFFDKLDMQWQRFI